MDFQINVPSESINPNRESVLVHVFLPKASAAKAPSTEVKLLTQPLDIPSRVFENQDPQCLI
jgi:hypothetical protein